MIKVIRGNPESIRKHWDEIYLNNSNLSAYQSYDFLNNTGIGKLDKKPWRTIGLKKIYFVQYYGDKPTCIASLLYKLFNKKADIYIQGAFTSAGYLDFIYNDDWGYNSFSTMMQGIEAEFVKDRINTTIHFDRINQRSKLQCFIEKYFHIDKHSFKRNDCVSIAVPNEYEEYWKILSKSTRQSIRTQLNKLNKRNKLWKFVVNIDETPDSLNNIYLEIYCKRIISRMNIGHRNSSHSVMKLLLLKILFAFKKNNPMTLALKENENYFSAHYEIDGKVASFCEGLICNDNRIVIPRLAIDEQYKEFGPGIL
ncbi:MAG: hypothetical protein WC231_00070 [Dehalococcoidales bacterium]